MSMNSINFLYLGELLKRKGSLNLIRYAFIKSFANGQFNMGKAHFVNKDYYQFIKSIIGSCT